MFKIILHEYSSTCPVYNAKEGILKFVNIWNWSPFFMQKNCLRQHNYVLYDYEHHKFDLLIAWQCYFIPKINTNLHEVLFWKMLETGISANAYVETAGKFITMNYLEVEES